MTDINRLKSLMEKALLGELEVHQDEATGVFEIRTALDGDVDGDTGRHVIVGGDLIAIMADALRDMDRADLFCAAINALPFLLSQSERTEALEAELAGVKHQRDGYRYHLNLCEQIAGKALGYPWFKDDQKNFPGTTEVDGVCIGEHVGDTIVEELANRFRAAQSDITTLKARVADKMEQLINCGCDLCKSRARALTTNGGAA